MCKRLFLIVNKCAAYNIASYIYFQSTFVSSNSVDTLCKWHGLDFVVECVLGHGPELDFWLLCRV